MSTYKLVPLRGSTGTQLVDGKDNARTIALEIAAREDTPVAVYPPGRGQPEFVEPDTPPTWTVVLSCDEDDLTRALNEIGCEAEIHPGRLIEGGPE